MKRRIVQHGSQSLTITLPYDWVRRYGLSKGDELDVEDQGSTLVIRTESEQTGQSKEINCRKGRFFTKNNLSHLYQLGYDEIRITDADPKVLQGVVDRIPDCIGFEILDRGRGTLHVKSIASTIEEEFETLLRKAFRLTNEMAEGIRDILSRKAFEELADLRELERLNNRFTDVCIRILNKRGHRARPMQMYEVVKNVERIADEFKHICDIPFTTGLSEDARQASHDAAGYYLSFYELFYKEDEAVKKRLFDERKRLTGDYKELLSRSTGPDTLLLHHSMNIVEKTFQAIGGYCAYTL